jgi:HlyD family secretion protein
MERAPLWPKIKMYLKKPWVIAGLAVLVLIIFFSVRGSSSTAQTEVITVKSGTVNAGVSVTGKVKASQTVDLAFEKGGTVIKAPKQVGDEVKVGDILVQLDNRDSAAQLAEAQAALQVQQSKLTELQRGTRPEQLTITKTKAQNAKTDLENARDSYSIALQNAYTSADDAIRNKIDEFFINPRSPNPQIKFTSLITSETSLETGRVEVENRLRDMKTLLATIGSSTSDTDFENAAATMKQDLGEIKLFLDNMSLSVNALVPADYLPLSTLTTWKSDTSIARTNVNTAITAVLTSEDKFHTTQGAYLVANQELSLDTSGVVSEEIAAQQAEVAQAQASVAAASAGYSKTFLKSPIDGVVTKQNAKVGEAVVGNTIVVSVMSNAQFQIEANVAEADIAKIKLNQKASVTLDAYGSDVVFDATVIAIDPAETIIDGVPTYKTTFQFTNADERIKSGMTANIDIQGETHDHVLVLPQRAIANHNGNKFVTLETGKNLTKQVEVKVGIRGEDGSVEILDGLKEGDNVVVSQQ